ncbi:MAG: hypothetical protein OCD76_20820 [Reichenbachiella sp.]
MNIKTIAISVLLFGAFTFSGFAQSTKTKSNDLDVEQKKPFMLEISFT